MSREPGGTAREARRLLRPLRAEILALTQALVRENTVACPPEGREAGAQRLLARALRRHRLEVELYDTGFLERSRHPYVRRDRRYHGRPNLVARLAGTGRGRSLLLSGHVDTVPPGREPWATSPWSGQVRRGRLYGRGSWDMKGGLAAQCAAAIALKEAGVRPGGDLLVESVVDEEFAGGGGTLAARLRGITADACAIGEPTNEEVYRASRGGHFFDLVCRAGDAASYFSKEPVVSPAIPAGRLLGWVDAWVERRRRVDRGEAYAGFSDPAPVQVLAVEANRTEPDVPWSVPLEARVRVYFQFLPHEDLAARVAEIEASLEELCATDPFFSRHPVVVERVVDPPLEGHELPADHPWTRCLHGAAEAVLRRSVPLTASEWPCDAFLSQRHFGIPTLVFGPRGAGAHNPDEHVETASLLRTAETYLAAALEWCGA
jgi:acetylornithine deacetylase